MLRLARTTVRRENGVANTLCGFAFAAIAILIVTVGTLSTESRLSARRQKTNSWHTSQTSRMTEGGVDELAPVMIEGAGIKIPVTLPDLTLHLALFEHPLPELSGAPQAHGLRAPPRA